MKTLEVYKLRKEQPHDPTVVIQSGTTNEGETACYIVDKPKIVVLVYHYKINEYFMVIHTNSGSIHVRFNEVIKRV